MKIISIYNNKGGVGKSTVTMFFADFFASLKIGGKKARILVLDLDGQGSTATSLLGLTTVTEAKAAKNCLPHLLLEIDQYKKAVLRDYLHIREKGHTKSKKIPLGEMAVMTPDRQSTLRFEQSLDTDTCVKTFKLLKSKIKNDYDVAFIDLPANIDERNKLALTGLQLSDLVVIPTEPTRIAINALNDTFDVIQYARKQSRGSGVKPKIAGILLNKTDRRTRQYKLHHRELTEIAARHDTVVFNNYLPAASTLAGASDDSLAFATLREKYDNNYDKVRKATLELAEKCGYKYKK